MKLTILGCHSATPTASTRPTSQVLEMRGNLFLIDCGEGTQMAMRLNRVKFSRIKNIFISHLHGDHFFGLIGMISTFCLLGRDTPLTIYGPKGIREIILLQLKLTKSYTTFDLRFREKQDSLSPAHLLLEPLCYSPQNMQWHPKPHWPLFHKKDFLFYRALLALAP